MCQYYSQLVAVELGVLVIDLEFRAYTLQAFKRNALSNGCQHTYIILLNFYAFSQRKSGFCQNTLYLYSYMRA